MLWWHHCRNWRLAGVTPVPQSWGTRRGAGEMCCRGVSVADKDMGRVLAPCWEQFDGILSWRE